MARLSHGTRFGAYDVLGGIGAGGMGEVYRARDAKLNRDVALKVLPELFAVDPDRLARFKREAQVLASLNHPNIAAIYGLEESNPSPGSGQAAVQALVLELVEGPTLADRIAHGPIAAEEALPIARQIAEALEAAHEQGIIHRDLKPANIKLRPDGTVKVLDFGLAKALEPADALSGSATASPTITSPALTQMGVILGTAAYMSPEQVKGRPADKRSDVWAFGAVLYEMLSGRRAFKGDDVPDTLAAVLRQNVEWTALPASTPAPVRRLLARCLDRDLKRRLRDIGEARIALDDPTLLAGENSAQPAAVAPTRSLRQRAVPIALSAIIAGALTGATVWYLSRPSVPAASVTRFTLALAEGQTFTAAIPRQVIAVSSDGARIVYASNNRLYSRTMSELDAREIPGTEDRDGATDPVFSEDGLSLLFYATADRTIKKIPVTGGTAKPICRAAPPFGLRWQGDDIVFGQGGAGIMRVSANGGTPTVIARVADGEQAHGPQLLPGGRHVLFTIAAGSNPERWEKARIVIQPVGGGGAVTLIEVGSDARYLPTGHLVYASGSTLFAAPFDLAQLKLTGPGVPIVDSVMWSGGRSTGTYHFSISSSGTLIYIPGVVEFGRGRWEMIQADRNGAIERLKLPPLRYSSPPRVSPDGTRIAFGVDDGKEPSIYTYHLSETGPMQRFTDGGNNYFPTWSADSKRIAFQSDREGDLAIWQQSVLSGAAERLTKPAPGEAHAPESWHPKADLLLFSATKGTDTTLWTLSVPDRTATPFGNVHSMYPTGARFHPSGRWVAYTSRDQEITRIYVQAFPTGVRHELYVAGASAAPHKVAWSPDGKELFYVPRIREFEAVSITTEPAFAFGNAVKVPRPFGPGAPNSRTLFDVTPEGKFLALLPPGSTDGTVRSPSQIVVVLNWLEELRSRVPAAK